jgi:hypothetical protein
MQEMDFTPAALGTEARCDGCLREPGHQADQVLDPASAMGRGRQIRQVIISSLASCARPCSAHCPPHHAIRTGSASRSGEVRAASEAAPGSPASGIPRRGDGASVEQNVGSCAKTSSFSANLAVAISLPKWKRMPATHIRRRMWQVRARAPLPLGDQSTEEYYEHNTNGNNT